jgi:hypothetical protein
MFKSGTNVMIVKSVFKRSARAALAICPATHHSGRTALAAHD